MVLSDLHMHTHLSIDGCESVEALCEAAVGQGLQTIAITDHWDNFPPGVRDPGYEPHFMDSRDFWLLHGDALLPEIETARERYTGKLRIVYGVELGQPQFDLPETKKFLAAHHFDFVLASQHLNRDTKDYYTLDYTQIDIPQTMHDCFAMELEIARSGVADAIAHIDQPVRLMRDTEFDISLTAYRDEIAALLEEMIARGIALEINTHGLRNWYHRVSPPEWALQLYRDLGGRLVTLGSDAHVAAHVGCGIAEASALAEAYGLQVVSGFRNHEPIF